MENKTVSDGIGSYSLDVYPDAKVIVSKKKASIERLRVIKARSIEVNLPRIVLSSPT